MSIHAIAPSPLARLLLELETRAASGGIEAGGRRLVLLKGSLFDVRPAPEDDSLGEFLVAAGRLSVEELNEAKLLASERRVPLEAALRLKDLVPVDALLETRRALWIDRFVRGLAEEERAGKQPGLLSPEPHAMQGPTIPLLPFVLDGLTRRASLHDAEKIGRQADAWFEWLDTPQRERAEAWADFGNLEGPVQTAGLFARHPAAPSRIAALTRAGLARLSEKRLSIPPAAPRIPSIAPPAPAPEPVARGSIEPPQLSPLPALAPGEPGALRSPLGIDPLPTWFPAAVGTLDDPLDAIERRIAKLEQVGAPAEERASAWLALGQAWREHFDSTDECARASREAAAAATDDPLALEAAARNCSVIGRPELAYAYAASWAELLQDPTQKARALVQASGYGIRAGKESSALRALKHASELDTADGSIAERYARMLLVRGDVDAALQAAREAGARYREGAPRSARVILAWASTLAPNDPEVASDYASVLASEGHVEAAVAVLAQAARRARSPEIAGKLFRNAAVRSELSARPDLAADLLLEAIDTLGSGDAAINRALLNDLTTNGDVVEVAVMAAELSQTAQGATRAEYLVRAADARLELPGEPTLAVELYTQALCADPSNPRARAALRQIAESDADPRRMSEALERALRDAPSEQTAAALLDALLAELALRADAPFLERWAISEAERLRLSRTGERTEALDAREARYEAETRRLESDLRAAEAERRSQAALALADHLRDDPARRTTAQKLYEKVLETEPHNMLVRARLESLARLTGDTTSLCILASQRVQHASSDFARIAAMLSWVHAEYAAQNLRGALEACLALLTLAPKHREGALLQLRFARMLKDAPLICDALSRRVAASLDPRERAIMLCALARACLDAGDLAAAIEHAETALASDPRCAAAALLIVQNHHELPPQRLLPLLRSARTVLGDTPELLSLLAQAQFGVNDARGQRETLEAHLALAPFDALPALALLTLHASGNDADAISRALHETLRAERFGEGTALLAGGALDRLWLLGRRREAMTSVLFAVEELGEIADPLLDWASAYLEELNDPRLTRAILERMVVRATGEARGAALRRLATFHQTQSFRSGEARAYLRLLALEPADGAALDRLAYIYAETRELERLMAVLTLRLELSQSQSERRERLLSLACAALDLADDPAGAEDLVRAALASHPDLGEESDPSTEIVRRGVGLLLGSRSPQLAFDLLLSMSETAPPLRACELIEEAVFVAEEHLSNRDLALRAATLGLESHPEYTSFLLHFERLALELGDVATGREVYRHMAAAAIGMHGRRALLYRAGRWLERAGAHSDALEAVEQAFVLAPSEGAMLTALERLSRLSGQPEALVRALDLLAENAQFSREKSRILLRAGRVCEEDMQSPETALLCYERALRALPDQESEGLAFACLTKIGVASQESATQRLRALFSDQAQEAWATKPRVQALLSLARLELGYGRGPGEAEAHLQHVRSAIDEDEDLPEADRAELLALHASLTAALTAPRLHEVAEGARRGPPEELRDARPDGPAAARSADVPPRAQEVVASGPVEGAPGAPSELPYDPRARAMPLKPRAQPLTQGDRNAARRARSHTDPGIAPLPPRQARTSSTFEARSTQLGFRTLPGSATVADLRAEAHEPAPAPTRAPEPTRSSLRPVQAPEPLASPTPVNDADDRWLGALLEGDTEALGALLASPPTNPTHSDALCAALLARVRSTGRSNVPVLRALRLLGSNYPALVAVCNEAIAFFDPPQVAGQLSASGQESHEASFAETLLAAREDGDYAPTFTLLAHVAQGAAPLFRRTLSSYGVSVGDFVGRVEESPFAKPLSEVSARFGVELESYVRHTGEDRLTLIPTHPTAILIGDATSTEAHVLRYRLARMFECARPGSSLLATLTPDSAENLLLAVRAAFGPADSKGPPVAREAAALAAELWRTMPSATQRQVTNLFRVLPVLPSLPELLDHLSLRAARVGLVVGQSLHIALAQFGKDWDADSRPIVPTAQDLDLALRERAAVRGLLAFAFSETHLNFRATLLPGHRQD